ncbi:MAG: ferredoxin-type protein NapG [Deltaproteobacteria bacterium]|nr:ferredoxin-type protein NapG [Deltaproteobacteria bacterium]
MGAFLNRTAGESRRQFLARASRFAGMTLVGGLLWGWLVQESKAQPFALHPPGAKSGQDLQSRCIKCGMCVDACPYDTLSLSRAGDDGAPGVPYFVARNTPCYMCSDVPCARACPSGALDREVEITRARMGLAVLLDQENCIAFQGLRCEVCYRVCPLMGKAISLQYSPQERTGKHAFFRPVVHSQECTGCGMCEHACILEEPAIKVLTRRMAKGRLGRHYRLGWKEKGVISPDFTPDDAAPGPELKEWGRRSGERALKELNDTEGLYD